MTEPNTEFIKRKKSEKRAQAERQVRKAYEQRIKSEDEDASGLGLASFEGLEIDGKRYPWRIKMLPEIEDLYSTMDISKALEIPRERLRDWMVKGFIAPSLPSTSKGTIAIFTRTDVLCVALLNKLINRGFKREIASEYVTQLINAHPVPIGEINFLSLKTFLDNGELKSKAAVHYIDNQVNLTIDSAGNLLISPFDSEITAEWEDIHIINMIKLRNEIDQALANLH